jgi:hypothetical protein
VALGQDIVLTRTVALGDPTQNLKWGEVAIVACPIAPNEAALAMLSADGNRVYAVTTLDSFASSTLDPIPLAATVDPFVAASPQTGTIFVGGFSGSTIYGHRKIAGSAAVTSTPELAMVASAFGVDKPFAAIGPWPSPHTTPEVLHVAAIGAGGIAWAFHSRDEGDVGTEVPIEGDPGYPQLIHAEESSSAVTYGDGAYPLVVPSGPRAGRVIVPYAVRNSSGTRFLPAVTYTDTAGDSDGPNGRPWEQKVDLNSFGPSPGLPINVAAADKPFPSAAIDPIDPSIVYIAFIGNTGDTGSSDIFVARGTTDALAANMPLVFPPEDIVHITDTMLRPGGVDEGQTDESKVSIVIDSQQGVNLLYSRVPTFGQRQAVVRYARWESFQSLKNLDAGLVKSLSGPFDTWAGDHFDYQMMCLAGCQLYAAYPTNESGAWDMHVSVIRLNTQRCEPDPHCYANCDQSTTPPILNVADFTCFLQSFADGQSLDPNVQLTHYANCDQSTQQPVLNVADFTCFLQKMAAGCS